MGKDRYQSLVGEARRKQSRVRNVSPSVPTESDILAFHDREVERSGDSLGLVNRGSLLAAIDRAQHGPFRGPGSVLERAGLLLRGICQDHPFADGNKRTAFGATSMLLERNGLFVAANPEAVRDFMLEVAKIERDLDGIVVWLAQHVETIKENRSA